MGEDRSEYDFAITDGLSCLTEACHSASRHSGWYSNLDGSPKDRNVPEMLALIHSEVSETLEAYRKDLQGEHIMGFSGVEEELADVIIRVCDLAGYLHVRLGEAVLAKLEYNSKRKDHKLEARGLPGGKKF